MLTDLAQRARSGPPGSFMPYNRRKPEANILRCWSPLLVPGLLRPESYMRAVLSVEPYTAERLDAHCVYSTSGTSGGARESIYSEGGDLVFERTFDAPRERVWQAFTDPEIVPRWWGRHGTTTTVAEMDVRPGGKWRYISSAPDRDDVAFYGEYLSITPPEGFEWTFMFDVEGVGPQGGPEIASVRGPRRQDQGRLGRAHRIARDPRGALATGMAEGAIETWDRLAAVLAED